jgi:hypothetical protein
LQKRARFNNASTAPLEKCSSAAAWQKVRFRSGLLGMPPADHNANLMARVKAEPVSLAR